MKKIAVLFGGCSSEYEVSLQSAYAVIRHIDQTKYELVPIGIDKTGRWYLCEGDMDAIPNDRWQQERCYEAVVLPDKKMHGVLVFREGMSQRISLDAALPMLHGKNGEDGTVQGVLELAGIPIIGCGVLSSALCMDKEMAHRVVAAAGVKVPRAAVLTAHDRGWAKEAAHEICYPLFVKPLRAGSSFGITKVLCEEQLGAALDLAFTFDTVIVMEEMIKGFEVGCALLGTKELSIGEVDEIELSEGFFDYTEKYTLKSSRIHVPARIEEKWMQRIKETAKTIYKSLGCTCFARVDMFLTPEGEIYFNEVNTIPGFTEHSRYPGMMKAAGYSFAEIVDRILAVGLGDD